MGYPNPSGSMPYPSPWYPPLPPPRPVAATVLSIIGGAFITLGGCVELLIGVVVGAVGPPVFGFLLLAGFLAIGLGVAVMVAGSLLPSHVHAHVPIGITIVILSLVSIVGFGGFLLGLILGVIGGGLAIAFSPYPSYPSYPSYPYYGGPSFYPVPLVISPVPYGPGAQVLRRSARVPGALGIGQCPGLAGPQCQS